MVWKCTEEVRKWNEEDTKTTPGNYGCGEKRTELGEDRWLGVTGPEEKKKKKRRRRQQLSTYLFSTDAPANTSSHSLRLFDAENTFFHSPYTHGQRPTCQCKKQSKENILCNKCLLVGRFKIEKKKKTIKKIIKDWNPTSSHITFKGALIIIPMCIIFYVKLNIYDLVLFQRVCGLSGPNPYWTGLMELSLTSPSSTVKQVSNGNTFCQLTVNEALLPGKPGVVVTVGALLEAAGQHEDQMTAQLIFRKCKQEGTASRLISLADNNRRRRTPVWTVVGMTSL